MGGGQLDSSKKVLILYASAGHGHEKAARAVEQALLDSPQQISVRAVDTLSLDSGFLPKLYKQVYLLQIKYAPWLWGAFYYSFDIPAIYFFMRFIRRILNTFSGTSLERLLVSENPAVVICTHFMAAEVTSHLKARKKIQSKLFIIVTDYLPHYVWTAAKADAYAVALVETKDGLIHRGVSPDQIHIFGIPIEKKFLQRKSREELGGRLGLARGVFTVLLTSGGVGLSAIQKIAEGLLALRQPIQILVVSGTNQRLKNALEAKSAENPHLKVFGFVNNMDELMEVSDLVVGKAGGLTITESFCKAKPVVLFQAVPGQEVRNTFIVKKYGAGFATNSASEVISTISELSQSPEKMEHLREGVRRLARPEAAKDIARWVEHEL